MFCVYFSCTLTTGCVEVLGWGHEQAAGLQRAEEGDRQADGGPARLHRPAEHPGEQVLLHGPKPRRGGEVVSSAFREAARM